MERSAPRRGAGGARILFSASGFETGRKRTDALRLLQKGRRPDVEAHRRQGRRFRPMGRMDRPIGDGHRHAVHRAKGQDVRVHLRSHGQPEIRHLRRRRFDGTARSHRADVGARDERRHLRSRRLRRCVEAVRRMLRMHRLMAHRAMIHRHGGIGHCMHRGRRLRRRRRTRTRMLEHRQGDAGEHRDAQQRSDNAIWGGKRFHHLIALPVCRSGFVR